MYDAEKKYIGKRIATFGDEDTDKYGDRIVRIVFEDGTVLVGEPMGDCCAVTTIVEVTGADVRAGDELVSIEKKDLGSIESGWSTTDVFGTVVSVVRSLDTASGRLAQRDEVLILCTCRHNGYYGGWVEWMEQS